MAQTQIDRNELFFGVKGQPARYQNATITGAADLTEGTILVYDTGKYRAAIDADKAVTGAVDAGWRILLEDAAVSGGDVSAKTGRSGGVYKDKLVAGVGLTIDEAVYNKLEMNNIEVQAGTNSMSVAGE